MKRVGVTSGMRGYFAVLYDNDGPIQTGIGSYRTAAEAQGEAMEWAESEGLPCDFQRPPQPEQLPRRLRG